MVVVREVIGSVPTWDIFMSTTTTTKTHHDNPIKPILSK